MQYIQRTYGYLLPSRQAGHVAEHLAAGWLKSEGYTDIIALQNASGHGVDLVARHSTGRWMVFEVKGHIKQGAARVRGLASMGARKFAESVVERIASGRQGWDDITDTTRAAAKALEQYLATGKTLHGVVINVENALDAVSVVIKTKIWRILVK